MSWPGGVYNYLTFGTAGTSGTTLNNDLGAGVVTLISLTFQSGAPAYTINGNRINFWDAATISNSSSAIQTINAPLYFNSGPTFSGNFLLSGSLSGNGAGWTASSGTLQLTGSSPGFTNQLTLSSAKVVLGNKAALGTGLIKGTGSIEAAVDLVGDQSISNGYDTGDYGVLSIAGTNSLTTTGNVRLSPQAFQTTMINNLAPDKTFTISGTTTVNNQASVTTLTGSGNTTFAGPIVGSGGNFTSTNTGLTTFSGSNSYSGVTTVSKGTLLATMPVALPNYSTSGKVSVASGATLAVQAGGAGEWDGTAIDSLLATTAFSAGSSIGVSVTSGNSFQYGNNVGTTQASKGLTKRGAGTLALTGANTYTGATLVTGGTLQIGAGSTSGAIASTSIALSNNATLAFNRSDDYGGRFTKAISGAGNIVVSAGTLTVGSGVTYTGNTTVEAGVLRLNPTSFASPTGVSVQSAWNSTWSGTQTINGSGMTPSNPVTAFSTGSNSASGESWFSNATQSTWITWDLGSEKSVAGFHLWNFNAAGYTPRGVKVAQIYSGTSLLADGSSYAGAGSAWGTLVTTSTFTQAPGTTTYAGEDYLFASPVTTRYVQFKVVSNWSNNADQYTGLSEIGFYSPASDILPTTTNVTLSASGALDINGGGQSVNSLSSSSANARVWLGGGQLTVTGSSSTTFAGQITDSGGANAGVGGKVVKTGLGTLTLTGSNTYTGATTITGGTLQLGDGSATGSLNTGSTITGSAGATFAFNRTNTVASGTDFASTIGGAINVAQLGSGTLVLNGASTYSGTTTAGNGVLRFNSVASGTSPQALGTGSVVNLGVAGTSAGEIEYVGVTSGTLDKNVFALGTGQNGVRNSGAGALTLSGTLTKNGTVLRLRGGSAGINVTGIITGNSPNSDLAVQNGLTTLSAANSYTGPTFINASGTLALGINNAIPSNSAVTIGGSDAGGDGGPGRFSMGSFTNQIGSLSFSGSGGTIAMAPTSSATSTLVLSATGAVNLAGTSTLDLTGMATGDGLYKLLAGSSLSGTFASVTGLNSNYLLRYGTVNANEVDAQRRAEIGTITATPAAASIITGGSTAFTFTVQNSTPTGGASLVPTLSAGSNVAGSATLASVAAFSTSGSVSGFVFNGTSVGVGRTGLFTVNDSNAIAATGTGSVSVNVYGHAAPSLTSGTLTLGNIHVGYGASGTSSNSLSATNGSGSDYIVALKGSSSAASGSVSLNSIAGITAGGSGSISATLATGRSAGAINESFTYTFADDSSLSGASSNLGTATIAVTGNVYTGQSTWATNGGGNWGTLAGTGSNAFGSNWGTNQGSPGLDAAFANTDTATFGSALLSGTAAINTAGANISLKSLTFDNAAGSYAIYQTGGSGPLTLLASGTNSAGVTVSAGAHTIHADVTLGSNTVIDINAGAALTFHNNVSGSAAFGLTKTGSGTLYFNGDSNYAGNTSITQGTVSLLSGVNPLGSGSVTVYSGATLDFNYLSLSNPLTVLSGGILLNTSTQTFTVSSAVVFSGTTAGAVNVTAGGTATFESTVGTTVTVNSGGVADFTALSAGTPSVNVLGGGLVTVSGTAAGSYALAGTGTFSGPLTGSLNVSSGGVVAFNGSNTAGSTFNVASGGLVNVGSTASLGGQLHVSGSAVIAGAVASNADVVVQSGGMVKLVDGASFAQTSLTNDGTLVIDRSTNLTVAATISGSGGLQKTGAGTLFLSGNNGYTGATTISAGVVSVAGASALQSTSGVSIANGAGLTYTGGAGTLDRAITVTGGTGTVTNSGTGTLTLAGTLTKNGTVLQLSGGAFNVTGQIVGTNSNSDLYVNGASVTLSNTNTYNGPTYVFNSGTLALGVSNAIPSNSVVTLGASGTSSATGPGTLDLGGFTNTIGGLVFSGSGGTLKMAANQTAAPQLATSSSLSLGAGSTLDLTGMGTSAGLYKLVSYTSNTGTFATVTGLAAGYQLLYGGTALDAQQKAVLGTVTVTNPLTSIITGGSAAFTYTTANGAAGGGASLLFTGSGNSNVAGVSNGSAAAAGMSGAVTGLYFTGTGVGSGQTGTFSVNAPNAYGSITATGTVSVTVLDHATSSLGASLLKSTTVSLGTYNYSTHAWEAGSSTGFFTIHNLASHYGANLTADLSFLSVSGDGNGFSTNLNTFADIAGGTSSQFSIFYDPTGLSSSGIQSTTFAIFTSDDTTMSGAAASNTLYVTASVIIVPEPDTIIFAGIGIAMAGWSLWKRRRIAQILGK